MSYKSQKKIGTVDQQLNVFCSSSLDSFKTLGKLNINWKYRTKIFAKEKRAQRQPSSIYAVMCFFL